MHEEINTSHGPRCPLWWADDELATDAIEAAFRQGRDKTVEDVAHAAAQCIENGIDLHKYGDQAGVEGRLRVLSALLIGGVAECHRYDDRGVPDVRPHELLDQEERLHMAEQKGRIHFAKHIAHILELEFDDTRDNVVCANVTAAIEALVR